MLFLFYAAYLPRLVLIEYATWSDIVIVFYSTLRKVTDYPDRETPYTQGLWAARRRCIHVENNAHLAAFRKMCNILYDSIFLISNLYFLIFCLIRTDKIHRGALAIAP